MPLTDELVKRQLVVQAEQLQERVDSLKTSLHRSSQEQRSLQRRLDSALMRDPLGASASASWNPSRTSPLPRQAREAKDHRQYRDGLAARSETPTLTDSPYAGSGGESLVVGPSSESFDAAAYVSTSDAPCV